MPLFILNIVGFITAKWRLLLIAAGIIAVAVVVGMIFKACNRPPKLDEKQIQKNQEAIASRERQKMVEALAESRLAEQQIDANRADADNKKLDVLFAAREKAKTMTNEELAEALENLK